jgi:hypothetical protein
MTMEEPSERLRREVQEKNQTIDQQRNEIESLKKRLREVEYQKNQLQY